jgi:hypothetical protein
MKPDHRATQVERDCEFRIEKDRTVLCEEAHTVYDYAEFAARAARLMPNYGLEPKEYEYAKAEFRRAAAELSDYDRLLLARAGRANLATAASIDPEDEDKQLWDGAYLGDRYRHYRIVSDIIEDVLREIAAEEHLKGVEQDEDTHR